MSNYGYSSRPNELLRILRFLGFRMSWCLLPDYRSVVGAVSHSSPDHWDALAARDADTLVRSWLGSQCTLHCCLLSRSRSHQGLHHQRFIRVLSRKEQETQFGQKVNKFMTCQCRLQCHVLSYQRLCAYIITDSKGRFQVSVKYCLFSGSGWGLRTHPGQAKTHTCTMRRTPAQTTATPEPILGTHTVLWGIFYGHYKAIHGMLNVSDSRTKCFGAELHHIVTLAETLHCTTTLTDLKTLMLKPASCSSDFAWIWT